jgi:hypothetical protein
MMKYVQIKEIFLGNVTTYHAYMSCLHSLYELPDWLKSMEGSVPLYAMSNISLDLLNNMCSYLFLLTPIACRACIAIMAVTGESIHAVLAHASVARVGGAWAEGWAVLKGGCRASDAVFLLWNTAHLYTGYIIHCERIRNYRGSV